MSARKSLPGTLASPLLHWLLLVCGLAILTVLRIDELDQVAPIWVGSVAGTALGQIFARFRLRLWLTVFFTLNLMWFGPLMMLPFIGHSWATAESAILSFAPAALCGYFSLSERGALFAFWYPAVLWTLSILDGGAVRRDGHTVMGEQLSGAQSWVLLTGLGVLFLAAMRARETRRAAMWQSQATVRLAEPRDQVTLRESPLRFAGQLGWSAGIGLATLVLTAWIAPHLWQKEQVESRSAAAPPAPNHVPLPGGTGPAVECCPETPAVEVHRERVKEYFPILHPHDADTTPVPVQCAICRGGVPIGGPPTELTPDPVGPIADGRPTVVDNTPAAPLPPMPRGTAEPQALLAPVTTATVEPQATTPPPPPPVPMPHDVTPPPPPVAGAPPAVHRTDLPHPTPATALPAGSQPRHVAVVVVPRSAAPVDAGLPFRWLLLMSIIGVTLHALARPLRRLITLRHLDRGLWPETVGQRVSNLWQLALVGLRDAGFHLIPGEQPQAFARRVGVEGLAACATVLERARHGVRVEAADLEAMEKAARAVYYAGRSRAGWAGRAVSSMRWPLV